MDEAVAAGAKEVKFSKPVLSYVENFLGFPVGEAVPAGYYDRTLGAWVPSDNGRVIAVLSVTGGLADLDVNGSRVPADLAVLNALGITDDERRQLSALYQPGQSLWRVPVSHFTRGTTTGPTLRRSTPSLRTGRSRSRTTSGTRSPTARTARSSTARTKLWARPSR